jgi:hypothetical protein
MKRENFLNLHYAEIIPKSPLPEPHSFYLKGRGLSSRAASPRSPRQRAPQDFPRQFKTIRDRKRQKKTREKPASQPEQQTGLKIQTTSTTEGVKAKSHNRAPTSALIKLKAKLQTLTSMFCYE